MMNHTGHVTLTSWIFKKFLPGRYHRDMKILKRLASNFKRFRVYDIFKKEQIADDRGGAQIRNSKITSKWP